MSDPRPSTPPRRDVTQDRFHKSPLTPEQIRRIVRHQRLKAYILIAETNYDAKEENRLKAKARRQQLDAEAAADSGAGSGRTAAGGFVTGQKRPHDAIATRSSSGTLRDARQAQSEGSGQPGGIETARKFTGSSGTPSYVDYDFSRMTDTKGGFLTAEDDPHNKALHAARANDAEKPAHMTMAEWERHRLLKKLREQRAGPFEPGLSALKGQDEKEAGCRECNSLEVDWNWEGVFGIRVCNKCKEEKPEKYSLLTKTEAKADYMLTDPELKDQDLLPRLERPNPHKATYHAMQLFLRCQVEEYAFSHKKWGSAEKMDDEFARREKDKKKRKEAKWKGKLEELKKRTRVEAYKRAKARGAAGESEASFGDRIEKRGDKHEHEWGRPLQSPDGTSIKKCAVCSMEVEEVEL